MAQLQQQVFEALEMTDVDAIQELFPYFDRYRQASWQAILRGIRNAQR